MIATMREFKQGLLDREAGQVALMVRRWGQVEKALEGNMAALQAEIAASATSGTTMTTAQIMRMERYHTLLVQARSEVGRYQKWATGQIEDGQGEMLELGAEHAAAAIQATGVGIGFNRINVEALQNMVGLCADGSPLFDVLKLRALYPDAVQGLTDALVKGVGLGWNPHKTAAAMQDGLAAGLNKALVIARTEQLRAYRTASVEQYRESGVVSGFKRLAAKDERTCLACLSQDGERYEIEEDFSDHVCGRCTPVPLIEGMPEVQWQTGKDWFEGLDPEKQREMMGDERFEAWQGGDGFDFSALATRTHDDTWGDGLRVTPLEELIA